MYFIVFKNIKTKTCCVKKINSEISASLFMVNLSNLETPKTDPYFLKQQKLHRRP